MAPARTIDAYHSLLSDALAQDSHAYLLEQLERRTLSFGSRPLCSVLRPRFLEPQEYAFLQQRGHLLLQAFARAHEKAMLDARFRQQFGNQQVSQFLLEYRLADFLRVQGNVAEGDGLTAGNRSLTQRVERYGMDLVFHFSF